MLCEAAIRLGGVLREHDTVARVGGDEFVVVLEAWQRDGRPAGAPPSQPPAGDALALEVARRIQSALSQPTTYDGIAHSISVSIGIAVAPPGPTGLTGAAAVLTLASRLVQAADAAMYRAKAAGKNSIVAASSA